MRRGSAVPLSASSFLSTTLRLLCAVVLFAGLPSASAGELRLPPIFGDSMVLQQNEPIVVWGWGEAGADVTATFADGKARTRVETDGQWKLTLPPVSASSKGRTMGIRSGRDSIELTDVLVGEVWFCSGQSNMVWTIRGSAKADEFIAAADEPRIRMFLANLSSMHEPQESLDGRWLSATPETLAEFSAVAYHFGRRLIAELDVPIGLVKSAWGGSTAEAWVRRPALEQIPAAREFIDAYDELYAASQMVLKEFVGKDVGDKASWIELRAPGTIESQGHEVDGLMWFRRTVNIPRSWKGRDLTLRLGPIDDNDITYFNGTRVGATNNWRQPREYTVPAAAVEAGPAVLAVRVEDTGGGGGFHGDEASMTLAPAAERGKPLSLAGAWKVRFLSNQKAMPAQHRPANLHNGMVHPLCDLPIRGVIWYQGESNAIRPRGEEYQALFPALIADWRDSFGRPNLPFYFVQLPNFTSNEPNTVWRYPVVRQAQLDTFREVPGTGMAVTLDLGEAKDIHPRNKHDVGERLSRWALHDVYGKTDLVRSGPILSKAVRKGGGTIVLHFELYGSSLAIRPGSETLALFETAGRDGTFSPARAVIRGDTVIVSSPRLIDQVRYAWRNNAEEANLVNAEGWPASPFTIRPE